MVITINKNASKKDLDVALSKLKSGKAFDAKKHCGKVKWDENDVNYQKKLRNEWE